MKFNAFRMKTTGMFFIVVHDHPRSKYFYCLNVYHSLIERMEKRCWQQAGFMHEVVDMRSLTSNEMITVHNLLCNLACLRCSYQITNNMLKKLSDKAIAIAQIYSTQAVD